MQGYRKASAMIRSAPAAAQRESADTGERGMIGYWAAIIAIPLPLPPSREGRGNEARSSLPLPLREGGRGRGVQ